MNLPTKKQWEKGYRLCLRCDKVMRPGEYYRVENPSEYFGEPWSWIHKREIKCQHGFFTCPGQKCDHGTLK